MAGRIMVPIKRGEASLLGLREAVRLAQRAAAQILLVHVVDEPLVATPERDFVGTPGEAFDLLMAGGQQLLDEARHLATDAGIDCATALCDGASKSVADEITLQARQWAADLLVFGVPSSGLPCPLAERLRGRLAVPVLTVTSMDAATP